MRESQAGARRWRWSGTGAGALTFTFGLAIFAYFGLFMRPSGDDYCYSVPLQQVGFWKAQVGSYLGTIPVAYHGDRYSLTLLSGISAVLGSRLYGWIPAGTILLWVVAMAWAVHGGLRRLRSKRPLLLAFYITVVVVFLSLYQAPDRMQSLYWRSAMLPYLMPLVLIWLNLGLVLWQPGSDRWDLLRIVAAFVLAFLAGGFSEIAATVQLGCYAVALSVYLVLAKARASTKDRTLTVLGSAALGSICAIVALIASPFSRAALAGGGGHPDLAELIVHSLRGGLSFTRLTLEGLPLPSAITLLLGMALGMGFLPPMADGPGGRRPHMRWLGGVLVVVAVGILLVGSTYTAPYFSRLQMPEPRAEIESRHVTVLMLFAVGILMGWLVGSLPRPSGRLAGGVLLGALAIQWVLAGYPIYGSRRTLVEVPHFRQWAREWDARDSQIRSAVAAGALDIHVPELDHSIPRVAELSPDPQSWYNQCAAGYYGARSIAADVAEGE